MKLLLDENLSRRVIPFIQAEYPGSTQIALLGNPSCHLSGDEDRIRNMIFQAAN